MDEERVRQELNKAREREKEEKRRVRDTKVFISKGNLGAASVRKIWYLTRLVDKSQI